MILTWKALHSLYNSILGKSLLIVSLATPVALMYNVTSLIPSKFPIVLLGALLALLGYVYTEISTPELIKDFKNSHDYSTALIKISKQVDWVSEFKVLEDKSEDLEPCMDSYSVKLYEFKSIDKSKKYLGEDKAIRSLALIKFNYINLSMKIKRTILSINFYASMILIFLSTIIHIKTVLLG
jgi:hypothetical protein